MLKVVPGVVEYKDEQSSQPGWTAGYCRKFPSTLRLVRHAVSSVMDIPDVFLQFRSHTYSASDLSV